MRKKHAVIIVIAGTISELLIFFLALSTTPHFAFNKEIYPFEFGRSVIDLFILETCKALCIFLIICGIAFKEVWVRGLLCSLKQIILYFTFIVGLYIIMKFLYFAEQKGNINRWILQICSLVSNLNLNMYIRLLVNYKLSTNKLQRRHSYEELVDHEKKTFQDKYPNEKSETDKNEAAKIPFHKVLLFMIKMAQKDGGYLFLAMLGITIWAIAQSLYPLIAGNVINYIAIERSQKKFNEALINLGLVIIATGIGASMRAGFFTFFHGRYMIRVQNKLFQSILNMEIGFFDVRQTGEITSRLTTDCTKLSESLSFNLQLLVADIANVIGVLFFTMGISWKLSLLSLTRVPLMLIITEGFGEKYESISQKLLSSQAEANACADEAISNIRTVRSFAAENYEGKSYSDKLMGTYNLHKQKSFIAATFWAASDSAGLIIQLLVFLYGGHLIITNEIQPGHLISFIFYMNQINESFQQISFIYTGVMEGVGAARNILFYIDRQPPANKLSWSFKNDGHIKGNIKFKDVTFAYPSREENIVLKDINFEVKTGKVVALVGCSGAGKSSIVNLLQRFYKPIEGNITIDGIPLENYEHAFIHQEMSIVQQEPVLFAKTIYENINYSLNSYEANKIETENTAKMANAYDFIDNFPEKFHTDVGEKGIQLSGGQKQRIAIARALIRDPKILILDEATSALDYESEYLVQQAINKNLANRTVLIIAHRLSTIRNADKILVLQDGKIIETGIHEDLLKKRGEYAKLFNRQLEQNECLYNGE